MPSPSYLPINDKIEYTDRRLLLVVILGPTAVGKTEISLKLADIFNGEIVSADSRLFYKGMDIGTAKPSLEVRARIPHHLIDASKPDQRWSLALFQQCAIKAIDDIHDRGKLPFLVGGTGQYIKAVAEGWVIPEVEPNYRLRSALKAWSEEIGKQGLYDRLATIDPAAAILIDSRNLRRTIRALEVIFSTGKRFSTQRRSTQAPFNLLKLGLNRPRTELYERIDRRIDAMLEAGFVDEVGDLINEGYPAELPSFSAIGYRELISYHKGEISLEEAIRLIRRATRIYVRRQANWFKEDDPTIRWFTVGPNTISEIEATIHDWINDDVRV